MNAAHITWYVIASRITHHVSRSLFPLRHIVQRFHLIITQFPAQRAFHLAPLLDGVDADDGAADGGLLHHPHQRHLQHALAARRCNLVEFIDHGEVLLRQRMPQIPAARALFHFHAAPIFSAEQTARNGRIRNHADAIFQAHGAMLAFELGAMHQIVVRLKRIVARQIKSIAGPQRFHQMPRRQIGTADVANFTGFHQIIHGAQRLIEWGLFVPEVRLIQIDIVGLQTSQRSLACIQNMLAAQALIVGARAHRSTHFRGQDDLIARLSLQPLADQFFGHAARIARCPARVDIGRVDEVAARIHKRIHHGRAVFARRSPAKTHAAHAQFTDFEAGTAQVLVFHVSPFTSNGSPYTSRNILAAPVRTDVHGTGKPNSRCAFDESNQRNSFVSRICSPLRGNLGPTIAVDQIERHRRDRDRPLRLRKTRHLRADDFTRHLDRLSIREVLAAEDVAFTRSAFLRRRDVPRHHILHRDKIHAALWNHRNVAMRGLTQDAARNPVDVARRR